MEKQSFWKYEWNLFLQDMQELGEFCLQPIEITGIPWKKQPQMLKPTIQEIEQKADQVGFWQNEWNLFKKDISNVVDFLTQPVTFK